MGRLNPEDFDVQFAKAHEFAQVAEALGINTDQVLAYGDIPGEDYSMALYTPDDDPEYIWYARIRRDADAVMHADMNKRHATIQELHDRIGAQLGDRFGPPDAS